MSHNSTHYAFLTYPNYQTIDGAMVTHSINVISFSNIPSFLGGYLPNTEDVAVYKKSDFTQEETDLIESNGGKVFEGSEALFDYLNAYPKPE